MRTGLLTVFIFLFSQNAFSLSLHSKVENEYLNKGGSKRALSHLKCFLHNYSEADFNLKKANLSERCNGMSDSKRTVQINDTKRVILVDYTKNSGTRRLFILDLEQPQRPYVETYYVSHGRYKANYINSTPAIDQNTVTDISYFSNVYNSNASSSGFFITGHTYQGRWVGPQGDKFSLIIHGVSKDLNDNSCDRAIVVHGNGYVKESGSDEGVTRMSSGCFMLDYDVVNSVLAKIRGGGGSHHQNEARLGGSLLFTYGSSEAALNSNYYCTPESKNSLRL